MFGWSRLGLLQFISSNTILFNLPAEHYSFYQPNRLKIFNTSTRWKTRQEKGTCEKSVLGGKPDVRMKERKKTANADTDRGA